MSKIQKGGDQEDFSLNELCTITLAPAEILIEIVEQGIVAPEGETPEQWRFDTPMLLTIKKAIRIRQDLEIDWPGVALTTSLLEEMQQLREENYALKQQIKRFHKEQD